MQSSWYRRINPKSSQCHHTVDFYSNQLSSARFYQCGHSANIWSQLTELTRFVTAICGSYQWLTRGQINCDDMQVRPGLLTAASVSHVKWKLRILLANLLLLFPVSSFIHSDTRFRIYNRFILEWISKWKQQTQTHFSCYKNYFSTWRKITAIRKTK